MVAIRHVAERAGVSTMSVSRVLNDSPLVNEATRRRVLQAMADLDYTPNASARSLKQGRSRLLGVLIPDTNNPIYGLYVDGIKDTAYRRGYSVLLCKTNDNTASDTACIRLLLEHRVTGVILTSGGWRGPNPHLNGSGTAVVCIDYRLRGCDRVTLDNGAAMRLAVDHLMQLGHRSIGMIAGPMRIRSEAERLVGFRRAARARGLRTESRLQSTALDFRDDDAAAAAHRILSQPDRPSALIVSSSALTPGVLAAAGRARLSVPGDLALIGVGEMSWTPALISPITTLVEPAYEMGVRACEMLLERATLDESGPPRSLSYPPRLAVRLSCGAPIAMRDEPLRTAHSLLFAAVQPQIIASTPQPSAF